MERSIALSIIIIMIIGFVIFLFKKYYLKHLIYCGVITKGTTSFINKYGECICAWIKEHASDDNYFEKKKEFDDRYTRTVKRSQRYAKRLFAFRLIEFLIKGTSDEKECLSKESFFKEHTQLIKDIEAELP